MVVHKEYKFLCVSGTLPGGEDYAWDGKGCGLESDQELFFFKLEIFLSKKCRPLCFDYYLSFISEYGENVYHLKG